MMTQRGRLAVLLTALAVAAACGGNTPRPKSAPEVNPGPGTSPTASARELTADQQAAQALSRLTFGPRPGELARVIAMGTDKWIDQQLTPEQIPDPVADELLRELPAWSASVTALVDSFPPPQIFLRNLRTARG